MENPRDNIPCMLSVRGFDYCSSAYARQFAGTYLSFKVPVTVDNTSTVGADEE